MLRRTVCSQIHLFSALVPHPSPANDKLFTDKQLAAAKSALEEREDFFPATEFSKCLEGVQNIKDSRHRHELVQQLSAIVDVYRAELYKKTTTDPSQRLQLHEAIMAAGFYQRSISVNELQGEAIRFVLNHYNFDVRRDAAVTKKAHDSLHEDKETTPESDKLLRDLLQLERRLSGKYRLAPTGGRRWLVLGQALSEVKTREELERVLALEPIKVDGNFSATEVDTEKLWLTISVTANAEKETSFFEAAGLQTNVRENEVSYELRVQKPAKPLDFWEKLSDALMRYWVIWFSIWVTFFMVDEEILTLLALIFLKHRQTSIMEAEAERSGGKVYVASASGRFGQ